MAERAMSTLKVLRVLVDHAMEDDGLHGLQLGREAHVASGTLYPILDRLEDEGLIVGEFEADGARTTGGPRRRYYSLTGTGHQLAVEELTRAAEAITPKLWRPRPLTGRA